MNLLRVLFTQMKPSNTVRRGSTILRDKNGFFILAHSGGCDKPAATKSVPSELVGIFLCTDELRSSIAAVHGLGGDADSTWDNEGNIWLRDFEPS